MLGHRRHGTIAAEAILQGIDHFLIMHVDVGFTFSEMFDFYLDITLPSVL